jgi:hypothetical protein
MSEQYDRKRLRDELLGKPIAAQGSTPPARGSEEDATDPDEWKSDVQLLTKFLRDTQSILTHVINERIPELKKSFTRTMWGEASSSITSAINTLTGIESSANNETFLGLKKAGLVGDSLLAKLDELRESIKRRPLEAVLDMIDVIMGSLSSVLPVLEVVKEAKEVIEHKIKHGGDKGIISLNLY